MSTESRWAVMAVQSWKSMECLGRPLQVSPPSMIGFIPVFNTREAAEAWKEDGHDVVEMTIQKSADKTGTQTHADELNERPFTDLPDERVEGYQHLKLPEGE